MASVSPERYGDFAADLHIDFIGTDLNWHRRIKDVLAQARQAHDAVDVWLGAQ